MMVSKSPSQSSPAPTPHERAALFAAEIGEVPECDLHGMRADEARHAVDTFLHHAFMQHASAVRIIHGRGADILRRTVHELLAHHPLIATFQDAEAPPFAGAVTAALLL